MSSSSSRSLDPNLALTLSQTLQSPTNEEALKPQQRNMRLIQLLLSSAKHASSGNLHQADAYLRQISRLASVSGDSMQRLAARFASALATRLVKRWPGIYKALNYSQSVGPEHMLAQPIFTLAFPYMGLAYAMVAGPLVQALSRDRGPVIHIIDLGSGDPKLWAPVIRSIGQIPDGLTHLKITCVSSNQAILHKLGAKLMKEADCVGISFQYVPLNVGLRDLTIGMLNVKQGEALGLVSILGLHALLAEDDRVEAHFGTSRTNGVKDCKQIEEFLAMIRSMSPKIMFLVEQEADHNMNRLVDRFVEGLHYYSAVFDSIDANFKTSSSSEERVILEEMLGREIENIVSCEGLERIQRHERYGKWMVRFTQAGFRPVNLWFGGRHEGKDMVEVFGQDGYKIIADRNRKMICWHERALYSVSAWTS